MVVSSSREKTDVIPEPGRGGRQMRVTLREYDMGVTRSESDHTAIGEEGWIGEQECRGSIHDGPGLQRVCDVPGYTRVAEPGTERPPFCRVIEGRDTPPGIPDVRAHG